MEITDNAKEAVKEMLRHVFEDCGMQKVWCGYYEGNAKSKCVQEKCSFKYQWKSENVDVPLMEAVRSGGDLENLGGDDCICYFSGVALMLFDILILGPGIYF